MDWTIPGTVLTTRREDAAHVEEQFRAMFLPGGMALGQITAITGLEGYTVQNWVKRGFLTAPQNKRYTLRQLCRILNINLLKGALPLESVCKLLSYVNGQLDDESDDTIDDADLYFIFIRLAARSKALYQEENRDVVLEQELFDYAEPAPGAKARVKEVLRVMLTAWLAARMAQEADRMLSNLQSQSERNDVK